MTKRIFISQEGIDNSISIFHVEPITIVIADRKDLNGVAKLEEAHMPGIYILLGENRRYVGQASGEIITRLDIHEKTRTWWNKMIFFGREDGHLDKSQTDYLERKLIMKFNDSDMALENGTIGNASYIDKLNKSRANGMLTSFEATLANVINLDLFTSEKEDVAQINELDKIIIFNGISYRGRSSREAFVNFMTAVITNQDNDISLALITAEQKPTSTEIIGTEPAISPKGAKLSREILPKKHVYVNFSREDLKKRAIQVSELLNDSIKVCW